MARFDSQKLAVLADLRRAAGLSQSQVAEFFGMQHRDSVSAWELGKRRPHPTRRSRFIVYLLDKLGLRRDGQRFLEVWDAVLIGECGWQPLSDEELQTCFPSTWQQLAARQFEMAWRAFAGDQARVPALHQLPPPPRDFTGRAAELAALRAAIEEGATIAGLWGMGGIGKTALALKLAAEFTPRYPDAQFYLDLRGTSPQPLSPTDAMAHVIRAYHPTARLPESESELSSLYQSVLHDQRALLPMDNAASARKIAPLIPPASCLLLVTSRQHFTLPGLFAMNLDTLPPQDARDLLLTIAPRIGDQADALARLCGYLPLALRLTASALAARIDLRPADHVRRLGDTTHRLQAIVAALSLSHEALGVEASLNLSYELLSTELQALWSMLAVFSDTFDVPATAAVWEVEPEPAHDALSTLVTRSLVEWNPAIARYRLHDLARLFADAHLSESVRAAARRRHAAYYETVIRTAGQLYHQGGEALKRGLDLFDLDKHLHSLGSACLDLGQPRRVIRFCQQALTILRQVGDRRGEGNVLGDLGLAYAELGETRRAIWFYEQQLAIAHQIGDRRGEGNALGNLGLAFKNLGDLHRAIEFYHKAVAIAREIGDRHGEGVDLINLGVAHYYLGEPRRAIRFYEQALVIFRDIGDRRGEGDALRHLGVAHDLLGEPHRAIRFYEQALAIFREVDDRRREGNALWNLSQTLDNLGDRAQAVAHAEVALKIFEDIENPNAAEVREQLVRWCGQE
ncbi:MAG: tetratricopeptide repeat protein [Anaerolineae bacterium]